MGHNCGRQIPGERQAVFFFVKKLLVALLLPHTLILILLILSLVLILRRRRLGRILFVFTIFAFYFLSIRPVADLFLGGLENRFTLPQDIPRGVKHVLVLGGGTRNPRTTLPPSSRLTLSSQSRLLEGIRFLSRIENGVLILSGGVWKDNRLAVTGAETMQDLALQLGVPAEKILLELQSRDTLDQAKAAKSLLEDNPFLLVTSAFHMPRSMYLFRKAGLEPIAVPADFRGQREKPYGLFDLLPSPSSLQDTVLASKEYMGLFFYRIFN